MENRLAEQIGRSISVTPSQIQKVIELLDSGCTIPFIARYRKEVTGELDEVQIMGIRDLRTELENLSKRRAAILTSLEERELLTDSLKKAIERAEDLTSLEEIYLPYKQRRKNRADIAAEAGLTPLADWLHATSRLEGVITEANVWKKAEQFINPDKKIISPEAALQGARDILAQRFNEHTGIRKALRGLFEQQSELTAQFSRTADKHPEAKAFEQFKRWHEPAAAAPSHRILALFRAERLGILNVHALPDRERAHAMLLPRILPRRVNEANSAAQQVRNAAVDSYKRLIAPSLETMMKHQLKQRADREAVRVFSENLRELLLSPPLGAKRVLAIDPGLRTGCKVVCLDRQGELLEHTVIFPIVPFKQEEKSASVLASLCKKHDIEAIAVGNGTGGRETELFLRTRLRQDFPDIPVIMVNESGASVYSASHIAREEFPNEDITVRGAVSIGRRLLDPLAELVKIDPKSIGVGQYQHDVDQNLLKQSLEDVVTSCVNAVGVDLNTASRQLLSYVSGISSRSAGEICRYRHEHGTFRSRKELLDVTGIGQKAFEQCAGFLRIRDGKNPLDASAVHPESYPIVEQIAAKLGRSLTDLIGDAQIRGTLRLEDFVTERVGIPTLTDIVSELEKPGRDPRSDFTTTRFDDGITEITDLKPGMRIPGIITNVTDFGAFVDVGVHKDGLVHVSQLSDHFVRHPQDVVKVNQQVTVTVLEVDAERLRIHLSMKNQQKT
jgi:uncharacterized protein